MHKLKDFLLRHPIIKNILWALAVPIGGLMMLNLAFVADAVFQYALDAAVGVFTPVDNMGWHWFPPLKHTLYLFLLILITWPILKSKLHVLLKAIWLCVPLAAAALAFGILLYPHRVATAIVGALSGLGVMYSLWRTKSPWPYWWSFVYISILMFSIALFNVEI